MPPHRDPQAVPGDRRPVVRESEHDRAFRLAQMAREIAASQRLSGSHVVSRTQRGSWEPQPPAVPAERDQIDWHAAEHQWTEEPAPPPREITVERVDDAWEVKARRLPAEIDQLKLENRPGRW
jgi:hypothetical protein